MPLALGTGTNPARYFQNNGGPFPGQNDFYNALKYYQNALVGPESMAPGQEATAAGMDQAVGGYDQNAPMVDPGSGGAQGYAQGAFGNLLTGEAAARNAGLMANAQGRAQAGSGVNSTIGAYGNSVGSTLQADEQLKNAQGPGFLMQGLAQVFDPADISGLFGTKGFFAPDPAHLGSMAGTGGGTSGASAPLSSASAAQSGSGGFVSPSTYGDISSGSLAGTGLTSSDIAAVGPSAGTVATTAGGGLSDWLASLFAF